MTAGRAVRWVTAFIDQPAERFAAGTAFWEGVTQTQVSPARGDDGEFATLLPASGDACLRVQRGPADAPRVHLDLHVDHIGSAHQAALTLGACTLEQPGHIIMESPGGLVFCLVAHHGECEVPEPIVLGALNVLDQISIDIPAECFDLECDFWAALTGWERLATSRPEFNALVRPPAMPYRFLLHRLDEPTGRVRAHLDIACGDGIDAVARKHLEAGASLVDDNHPWTTLRDPAGLAYCLTPRDPATGTLA